MNRIRIIDELNKNKKLDIEKWQFLISDYTDEDYEYAASLARQISLENFSNKLYLRGIIEFTNICKNDCLYCGIRRSNCNAERYRLDKEQIMECCELGYDLGYRTFVLQGGEDTHFNDELLCDIIRTIKTKYPDCAITMSVGERSFESYKNMFDAGADRYLLRHETAESTHYSKLHPDNMKLSSRIECLKNLKKIGYQTGCGMMIGSPYQTNYELSCDMKFISEFKPHMIGMGPFIPHKDTPFKNEETGSVELTLFLLSLCRIMLPRVLLPATTALGTVDGEGQKKGILSGCNVVMPNLSPLSVRKKYMLYDNKLGSEFDALQSLERLKKQVSDIGYEIVCEKGDYI